VSCRVSYNVRFMISMAELYVKTRQLEVYGHVHEGLAPQNGPHGKDEEPYGNHDTSPNYPHKNYFQALRDSYLNCPL